jgi:rare lipoprotein A
LNGRNVIVCINDRGPYAKGRIIDLSYAAARKINLNSRGIGKVDLEVVSDENGAPINTDKAWYVRYSAVKDGESVGPFRVFADAAAMHEALLQAHPEAEVVMDSAE